MHQIGNTLHQYIIHDIYFVQRISCRHLCPQLTAEVFKQAKMKAISRAHGILQLYKLQLSEGMHTAFSQEI
jgi:hypothetical protein